MKYSRVNLFGGACCGKTATASKLFSDLKINEGLKVALVSEYIKKWAYRGIIPSGFDEVFLFGAQLQEEELPLKTGEDIIVSDSPLLIHASYARVYECSVYQQLYEIASQVEKEYPSINILLDRTGIPYKEEGRFGDLAGAIKMDEIIKEDLDNSGLEYTTIKTLEYEKIIEYILGKINV
jgi:hypothetical protein